MERGGRMRKETEKRRGEERGSRQKGRPKIGRAGDGQEPVWFSAHWCFVIFALNLIYIQDKYLS